VSVILNRRESATVIAGLRLLAGDGCGFQIIRAYWWRDCAMKRIRSRTFGSTRMRNTCAS